MLCQHWLFDLEGWMSGIMGCSGGFCSTVLVATVLVASVLNNASMFSSSLPHCHAAGLCFVLGWVVDMRCICCLIDPFSAVLICSCYCLSKCVAQDGWCCSLSDVADFCLPISLFTVAPPMLHAYWELLLVESCCSLIV